MLNEGFFSSIRNNTTLSILITFFQDSTVSTIKKYHARNKSHSNQKEISKIVSIGRWHNTINRKP